MFNGFVLENARFILNRLTDNLMYKPEEVNTILEKPKCDIKSYFAIRGFDENIQNIMFDEFNKFVETSYIYKYTKQMANTFTKGQQDFLFNKGFTKISDSAFCNDDLITISIQDNIFIARIITLNDTNQVSSATEIKSKENQNLEDFTKETINSLYL